ncbi:ATP-binding cassette domain-containing protein [Sphingomicrobium sp. XHP0239]|uniref:ABC transporter ATP-binding protein n=1 Tax=Sphingomicrobium maritimum TaxID=3133972 RepID=UPI0031CCADE0
MDLAIETKALTKRFGKATAVDGIDLKIPRGAIYGFLGSNGAGKSTAIRIILGLRSATSGTVELFGEKLDHRHRPLIGAMADSPGGAFYEHLSARDNLRVVAQSLGIEIEPDALLDRVGLDHARTKKVKAFSTGMRQRLGIARALIGDPALVIFDEPLNGLDPEGIREMRTLMRDIAKNRTLIICSHLLDEIEKVASHVGLLSKGRLIHQGPLDDIAIDTDIIELGASGAVMEALSPLAMQVNSIGADRWHVTPKEGLSASDINRELVGKGIAVDHLAQRRFSLEEFYHERISASHAGADHA